MQARITGIDRRRGRDRRHPAPAAAAQVAAALARDEIEIVFQPQFSSVDGSAVEAEALVRWSGLDGAALFSLAERAGETERLSRHVAARAMAAAAAWPDPLRLSLNVTPGWLATADFAAAIEAALAEAGLAPSRLTLEITEQSLLADLDRSAAELRAMAERGIGLALDDFGAGFCNFDYLKRLPVDALKLDRSMIRGIAQDARDLEVLRAIIAMARALGLKVVAEGVESEAQREIVVREGCHAWQGFLGAEPMTQAEFLRFAAA